MQPFTRTAGSFELSPETDGLVVRSTPIAEATAAAAALDRLAAAHAAAAAAGAPHVARILGRTRESVRFDCTPLFDLEELLRRVGRAGIRPGFGFVAEIALRCVETMEIASRLADVSVGSFALANVWLGRDGEMWLVGLGHNVVVFDEANRQTGAAGSVVAPEVAAGARSTAHSDLFAASRSILLGLLPHVEVPPILQAAFLGQPAGRVGQLVAWANEALWSPAEPLRRPAGDELRAHMDELCRELGVSPKGAIAEVVAEVLASTEPPREALVVASDKSWFRPPHAEPVELARRPILRALLGALVEAHDAGKRVPSEGLIAAAWPGDRMSADSARNRLHVALHALRRLGLGDLVTWTPDGYSIDARMTVVRA
jgi:hypothetical protein